MALSRLDQRLFELEDLFALKQNPLECAEVLISSGLVPNSQTCEKCGNKMNLIPKAKLVDGAYWRCRQSGGADCSSRSIRHGSNFFANAKLSPIRILIFAHLWARKVSAQALLNAAGISAKTAVDYRNFLREVCVKLANRVDKLGGPGKVVEIDESVFGRTKYGRGRQYTHSWVFGMVERGSRKAIAIVVEDRSRRTLEPLIRRHILPETTIISDEWRSYRFLEKAPEFTYYSINHSKEYSRIIDDAANAPSLPGAGNDKITWIDHPISNEKRIEGPVNVNTNSVEGFWAVMKDPVKRAKGTSFALLPSYIAEGTARFVYGNDFYAELLGEL